MAWSSHSNDDAICYILLVLLMMSCYDNCECKQMPLGILSHASNCSAVISWSVVTLLMTTCGAPVVGLHHVLHCTKATVEVAVPIFLGIFSVHHWWCTEISVKLLFWLSNLSANYFMMNYCKLCNACYTVVLLYTAWVHAHQKFTSLACYNFDIHQPVFMILAESYVFLYFYHHIWLSASWLPYKMQKCLFDSQLLMLVNNSTKSWNQYTGGCWIGHNL